MIILLNSKIIRAACVYFFLVPIKTRVAYACNTPILSKTEIIKIGAD